MFKHEDIASIGASGTAGAGSMRVGPNLPRLRMPAAQLAAHYRGYAAQSLILAQRQDRAGDKLTLINMAQAWVALAEQMEE